MAPRGWIKAALASVREAPLVSEGVEMLVLGLVLDFRFKSEVDFAALGTWGFESASL